jgi:hypothetical protein
VEHAASIDFALKTILEHFDQLELSELWNAAEVLAEQGNTRAREIEARYVDRVAAIPGRGPIEDVDLDELVSIARRVGGVGYARVLPALERVSVLGQDTHEMDADEYQGILIPEASLFWKLGDRARSEARVRAALAVATEESDYEPAQLERWLMLMARGIDPFGDD